MEEILSVYQRPHDPLRVYVILYSFGTRPGLFNKVELYTTRHSTL